MNIQQTEQKVISLRQLERDISADYSEARNVHASPSIIKGLRNELMDAKKLLEAFDRKQFEIENSKKKPSILVIPIVEGRKQWEELVKENQRKLMGESNADG